MIRHVIAGCVMLLLASSAQAADKKPFTQDDARKIVGDLQKIVTSNGIEKLMTIPVNGTQQWISIRGRDLDNPILLFIHGGPAAPEMPTSWTFQNGWEDYFTVVQWDQRGSGKTYLANDPAKIKPTVTKAQMISDAEEVVRYLRATYHKDKIFVLGHSWGSVLGLSLAAKHPEWLYAYIGMGQVIDAHANEREGYEAALKAAEAAHNETAIKELRAIAPYPDPSGKLSIPKILTERKWDRALGGMMYGKAVDDSDLYRSLSPDYSDEDLKSYELGEMASAPALMAQLTAFDFENVTKFGCPVFFFAGEDDRTTPESIVESYYPRIEAPKKGFFKIPHAAHYVVNEAPGIVLVDLVTKIRPLAQ